MFLVSPDFLQFKVTFVNSDVNNSIFQEGFLGIPFRIVTDSTNNQPSIWFFNCMNDTDDLQIRYYQNLKKFMFNRIPRESSPAIPRESSPARC